MRLLRKLRRPPIEWAYTDGGRADAGVVLTRRTGDCVVRAIAMATATHYAEVLGALNAKLAHDWEESWGEPLPDQLDARYGVPRFATDEYLLKDRGWTWTPTMGIGTGCRVHLRRAELPQVPIIARLSKHHCAVVDGVIYDDHDPSREGTRCVYGIFSESPLTEPLGAVRVPSRRQKERSL